MKRSIALLLAMTLSAAAQTTLPPPTPGGQVAPPYDTQDPRAAAPSQPENQMPPDTVAPRPAGRTRKGSKRKKSQHGGASQTNGASPQTSGTAPASQPHP